MDALLLDLDGTLVDSREYWFHVVTDASAFFRGRPVERAAFDATFGQAAAADAAEFFPAAGVADVEAFYDAAFSRRGHLLRVADGAWEVLTRAHQRGIPRACVTNSPRAFTEDVLRATGMAPWMTATACADDVEHAKPAPDMLHLAARRLGVAVERCVFIGDSRYDVMAARAAGCRVVGIHVEGDERVNSLRDVAARLGARTWTPAT